MGFRALKLLFEGFGGVKPCNHQYRGCHLKNPMDISIHVHTRMDRQAELRGNCYPRSCFQTRHFEKSRFLCFDSQKLVKLICDTVSVCNFVINHFNPTFSVQNMGNEAF